MAEAWSCIGPRRARSALSLLAGFVILSAASREAAAFEFSLDSNPTHFWWVTIGDQVQSNPRFPGSARYGASALPSLAVRGVGEPEAFSAPDDSIGLPVFSNDQFRIGPVGNIDTGRYTSQDRRLAGIRDVSWGIEAGAFAEYWPLRDRLRLRTEIRYGSGYQGIVADFGGDWIERFGRFTAALGPRVELADQNYMRKYFGITAAESLTNGLLPAYSLGGGVKSAGVAASVTYQWNDDWRATAFARYDRLVDAVADSPIVTKLGTPDQLTVGLHIEYTFRAGL